MRTLIVTADDFGISPSVNAAVVRAYREGILRFTSLMVLREHAEDAARLAEENPGLGVGLHLELCASAPAKAGLRYFFDPKARAGLEGEIRAQLDRLLSLGVTPTHVDGHINVHVHPVIFPALCRVAREYKVPRVRLPAGEFAVWRRYPGRDRTLHSLGLAAVFYGMGAWVKGAAEGLELPGTWGLLRSGLMSEDYLLWLIENLPEGETEIYVHPSSDPRDVPGAASPTPAHHSIRELAALVSPRVREALARLGIRLAEKSARLER